MASSAKISQLPSIQYINANTSNTYILGVDIANNITGHLTITTLAAGIFSNNALIVGQNPINGFVTDVVEDELAFSMESLNLPNEVMRKRTEEVLDLLSLAPIRDRKIATLSGGEQQRVAIAAAMVLHPKILVLDMIIAKKIRRCFPHII